MEFTLTGAQTSSDPYTRPAISSGTYDARLWKQRLRSETAQFPALERIGLQLEALWAPEAEVSEEALLSAVQQRARPFLEEIWQRLSRAERLILVQVAEGCLPNPKAIGTIGELKRRTTADDSVAASV